MTDKADIKIDYDNSLLSVSNSLLKYFHVPQAHASLPLLDAVLAKGYKNVVLMVLDGMGVNVLRQNLPADSFFNQNIRTAVSSVFPPTTAAATTAIHSGLAPIESGWLGWMIYFKPYQKIIEVFRNKEFYTGEPISEEPPATAFINYQSIYEKIVAQNEDVAYHRVFPDFEPNGAHSFEEMCERVQNIINGDNRRKIISAYWHDPDHSMHRAGVATPEISALLKDMETQVQNLFANVRDTLIIITADHGMTDVEYVALNDYPDLVETFRMEPTFEDRFVGFFIKEGCHQRFEELFHKYFGEDFVLFTTKEFFEAGILGTGKMHPLVPDMVGEYFAISTKERALEYLTPYLQGIDFKGAHAGFTPQEMTVPLILLEKS